MVKTRLALSLAREINVTLADDAVMALAQLTDDSLRELSDNFKRVSAHTHFKHGSTKLITREHVIEALQPSDS